MNTEVNEVRQEKMKEVKEKRKSGEWKIQTYKENTVKRERMIKITVICVKEEGKHWKKVTENEKAKQQKLRTESEKYEE